MISSNNVQDEAIQQSVSSPSELTQEDTVVEKFEYDDTIVVENAEETQDRQESSAYFNQALGTSLKQVQKTKAYSFNKILIVDDDEFSQTALEVILK